jgi:hypothetical protein
MGGKALNKYGVYTERKNTNEFNQIRQELIFKIAFDLGIYSNAVKCYYTKADHGDLDLLMQISPDKNINWREYLQKTFNPQAIHNNGGVYSFDYKNFQVDIIPIREDKWKIANVYYSYDPLGNIMGKTFHKFGLSYGWDGLFYKFRNFNGKNSQNILLTTDPERIFKFGGYDYDRYLKGFETLEDIFNFAIDGINFDTEMFQMENLKSIDKKRNRKRGSYHLFLNYLKDNNIHVTHLFNENKDTYITAIDFYFPEVKLMEKLKELKDKDNVDKYMSEKFNGNIIMQWLPELKGKELGDAITTFKCYWGNKFGDYIVNTSIDDIRDCFMLVYNVTYKKNK